MRETTILKYLRENPRFMRKHQAELTRMLRLAERDVVDLTGMQLVALRDENTKMRRQLHKWYAAAAANEQIIEFLHRLAIRLVAGDAKANPERLLAREMDKRLGIKLCKLVDLKKSGHKVSLADKRRLESSPGALRTAEPLPSFAKLVRRDHWEAILHIPVYLGTSLRAVVICGTQDAQDFPRDASSDYAVRLAELLAVCLK